ncbi:MAG: O-antigen ligase family protein [Mycobacterium sp.]|nr:O-antigen ligase family protein [Mycobacterium sp.]
MNAHLGQLGNLKSSAGILAGIVGLVWLATSFGKITLLGVVAVTALVVGIYVGLRHPLWFLYGLAVVIGALPFGYFPGVHVPLYLPFAFGAVVALFVHPRLARPIHPLEWAIIALVLTSILSVAITGTGIGDVIQIVRWCAVTLVALALSGLSWGHAQKFGRIFVYATLFNAVFGLYIVAFDPNQTSFKYLRIFGYAAKYTVTRFAYTDGGVERSMRLGGTAVDPNAEGIALVVAIVVCIVVMTGWQRIAIESIFGVSLLLTLSRAGMFTVVGGILLVLAFHTMRSRDRALALTAMVTAFIAAASVPEVRIRFVHSFSSDDVGSTSRIDAIREFPDTMAGYWLFGKGWNRLEFRDGNYAFVLNHVSNAPLLTIYRGGIFTGLAFFAIMLIGCIMSYRAIRSNHFPWAVYGGVFIGFCVVALELDHPVVGIPPATLEFSILLAFLVHVDRLRRAELARHARENSQQIPMAAAH